MLKLACLCAALGCKRMCLSHLPAHTPNTCFRCPQVFNFWFLLSTTSNISLLVYCTIELQYGVMFRDMFALKFPLGLGCGLSWISAVQVSESVPVGVGVCV